MCLFTTRYRSRYFSGKSHWRQVVLLKSSQKKWPTIESDRPAAGIARAIASQTAKNVSDVERDSLVSMVYFTVLVLSEDWIFIPQAGIGCASLH
jgi:hypothetical protein